MAGLVRILRDVGLAGDLAWDALTTALEQWPRSGVSESPGAWQMTTTWRRAIDRLRLSQWRERKRALRVHELEREHEHARAAVKGALDGSFGDDLLRLIFVACHPLLSMEARVALTLCLLGGLRTDEIARAFLIPEA